MKGDYANVWKEVPNLEEIVIRSGYEFDRCRVSSGSDHDTGLHAKHVPSKFRE
jgi:hypothetical protein